MVDQDMIDYVKMSRRNGKTDEQIKSSLLPGGWQLQDIDAAIRAADAQKKEETGQIKRVNFNFNWIKTLIAFGIVVVIINMALAAFNNIPKDILVSGSNVLINYGKLRISAAVAPEESYTFVINSGSNTKFNDGLFAAWSLEQANALKATYGDFTHCNSPGMSAGMNSLNTVVVFGADGPVRAKLKNLIKISMNEPVVELKARRLDIKEQTYNNTAFRLVGTGQDMYYLVRDMRIIKNDYNK